MTFNPDHPAAHHWYAINYLVPLTRFGEAAEELRRAGIADPLSMPIRVSVGLVSYFAHRFAQAELELTGVSPSTQDPGLRVCFSD